MKVKFKTNKTTEELITELEERLGIKLMARKENDIVHGHIERVGDYVTLVLYGRNENPNKDHKTTFKKSGFSKVSVVKSKIKDLMIK